MESLVFYVKGIMTERDRYKRERDELVKTLEAIVELDDGDKPDLWHFEKEFAQARAVLSTIKD